MGSLLGGLLLPDPEAEKRLEATLSAIVAAGRLSWSVIDKQVGIDRMKARKKQFRAEYETLRTAHAMALANAIEEQQKRIEAEKDYSRRLEKEVEDRSVTKPIDRKNFLAILARHLEAKREKENRATLGNG